MDYSEQTPNQLQQIDDGATQVPAAPVLAPSSLTAPVSLPILLPQISNSHNQLSSQQAQHFNNLRQKIQLFWETQKQHVEQTTNFKKHSFPLTRIRKLMKAEKDVHMIAAETPILFAKAVEMFILDLTLRGWTHTEEHGRRVLQTSDIAAAISEFDLFDFLVDVIPKDLMRPSNVTIPQAGSSAITYPYVPQQYPIGPSGTIIPTGGTHEQPGPYLALPQLPPPLNPYIDWSQQFKQQNQEQAITPWVPQPEQQNQEQVITPWVPQPQQQNQEQAMTPWVPRPQQQAITPPWVPQPQQQAITPWVPQPQQQNQEQAMTPWVLQPQQQNQEQPMTPWVPQPQQQAITSWVPQPEQQNQEQPMTPWVPQQNQEQPITPWVPQQNQVSSVPLAPQPPQMLQHNNQQQDDNEEA